MKLLSVLLFLISFSNSFCQNEYSDIFGDSTKKIEWSCSIMYLPSIQSESVFLEATTKGVTAKYGTYKIRKFYRRKKTRRIKLKKDDFVEMQALYTSLHQRHINFAISENDRDSLREFIKDTIYTGERRCKVDKQLLESYLLNDTIEIDMSVFAMDSLNDFLSGVVIDGAPFRFRTMSISSSNDTLVQLYDGNLYGGDRFRDLPKYLAHAVLYNETHLYDELPFKEYFSRSNMLRVILWYIEGKEGLIEFKPFELFLEEE